MQPFSFVPPITNKMLLRNEVVNFQAYSTVKSEKMAVEAPVKSMQVTDNSSEALHLTFTTDQHLLHIGEGMEYKGSCNV